jgi:hypothetical protein
MGMFDTIKCEVTLPINKKIAKNFRNKDWTEVAFQTKDLDCTLSNYIIKKNKSFVLKIEKNEWIPRKKEKGLRGFFEEIRKDKWKSPYEIVHKGTSYRKVKHTGVITFYSIEPDMNDNNWDLVFDAKFVDGLLVSLKLVDAKIWETAEEVKEKNESIAKLMSDSYNNPANKVRRFLNKVTFGYWRWSWNRIAGIVSSTGNKISRFILRYT